MAVVNTLKTGFTKSFRSGALWLFIIAVILSVLFALSVGGMILLQKAMLGLVTSFIGSIVFFLVTGMILNKRSSKRIGKR